MSDRGNLSRRQVLAGLSTLGAGIGTSVVGYDAASALYADTSQFLGNVVTVGELDLSIDYEVSYTSPTNEVDQHDSGTVNGDPSPDLDLRALYPGDRGRIELCPEPVGDPANPASIWLCGGLRDDGRKGRGLLKKIRAKLGYCDPTADSDTIDHVLVEGSLGSIFSHLNLGLPLDGDPATDERDCFDPGATTPCLCLDWWIPESVENGIRGQEFAFELVFHAEQCRHAEDSLNPCLEQKGISFVSFCNGRTDSPTASDVTIEDVHYNAESEPIAVDWTSEVGVDTVVLKYATTFENFYVGGAEEGTASVGAGDEWVPQFGQDDQTPSDPCPGDQTGVKFEYESEEGFYAESE